MYEIHLKKKKFNSGRYIRHCLITAHGSKVALIKVRNNGKKLLLIFFFVLFEWPKKNCLEKYKFKYLDIKK